MKLRNSQNKEIRQKGSATAEELKVIFEKANKDFLNDIETEKLFDFEVGEMTFCGSLMVKLDRSLKKHTIFRLFS